MKLLALALTLLCVPTITVLARLGETAEQIHQRYGKPVEAGKMPNEKDEAYERYEKDEFVVEVTLWKGISVTESYTKKDKSDVTESEAEHLLSLNAGGAKWTKPSVQGMPNTVFLMRDDNFAVATYGRITSGSPVKLHLQITEDAKKTLVTQEKLKSF